MRTALEEARTGAAEGGSPHRSRAGRRPWSARGYRQQLLPLYDYVLQAHAVPHVRWRRGHALPLIPNLPMDTGGRREDSGRGVRELQGR